MADPDYLADTNILLRISKRDDPNYVTVRTALHNIRARNARVCFTSQNLAEFWNVCTRPINQNGFGLNTAETNHRAQLIEATFTFLADNARVHSEWRRLVVTHSVMGVQVHDARLAAAMYVHGLSHLLTMNGRDFARYPSLNIIHPSQLVS